MSHKGKSVAANTTHQRGIRGSVARADTRPFEHVVRRADMANSVIDHRMFPPVYCPSACGASLLSIA